ncbi:MAG: hypothetical protein A2015_01815 [Spirochaetes bacterium GWF1_31_7]|nr:MAG: hypothetical protein A2Y30_00765 [Spirochaetes bacterium GWE1_32_154]OHD45944.1 MAG: hypothetical protein A2Y29_16610 [Spirochaetes bacterium GWE2_31_10]OHD48109.1 MAG: hypothetical protein A2015_01815 [Spirochaetes bacterium GWF1_31_7]OHD80416.1 MAG: hypothetical protein A2355_13115 [Spirochaetes bacterium RIFOXYB1_FULL_32_8]HBD95811.1 hypothetical protein [Spirochaetia bacterium]
MKKSIIFIILMITGNLGALTLNNFGFFSQMMYHEQADIVLYRTVVSPGFSFIYTNEHRNGKISFFNEVSSTSSVTPFVFRNRKLVDETPNMSFEHTSEYSLRIYLPERFRFRYITGFGAGVIMKTDIFPAGINLYFTILRVIPHVFLSQGLSIQPVKRCNIVITNSSGGGYGIMQQFNELKYTANQPVYMVNNSLNISCNYKLTRSLSIEAGYRNDFRVVLAVGDFIPDVFFNNSIRVGVVYALY